MLSVEEEMCNSHEKYFFIKELAVRLIVTYSAELWTLTKQKGKRLSDVGKKITEKNTRKNIQKWLLENKNESRNL